MNEHHEQFLAFMKEQVEAAKKDIDLQLYNEVRVLAQRLVTIDKSDEEEMHTIFLAMSQKAHDLPDRNKLSHIYFYEQQYGNGSEELLYSTSFLLELSTRQFEESNFKYLEKIILENQGEIKEELALVLLLKVASSEVRQQQTLEFIKKNFDRLSDNNKNRAVGLLAKHFADNKVAQQIVADSNIERVTLTYGGSQKPEKQKEGGLMSIVKGWFR